ncbi:MAG: glycosyltransferase family 1 protein [Patescibacteria group bacterium]
MLIGIDIRCLLEAQPSGVSFYTQNLLDNLLRLNTEHDYLLFYNSFQPVHKEIISRLSKYPRVQIKKFSYPNKLFNFFTNFLHWPKIDKLIGGVDVFFAPNLQFISLSKECRVVVTVHDLSFNLFPHFLSFKRKLWHKLINPKKFIQTADKIIADSFNTKKDLISLFQISENKIEVVHLGGSIKNENNNSESFSGSLPQNYILSVSTLEPRKNISGLIDAFNIVSASPNNFDLHLLIVGPAGWKNSDIYNKSKNNSKIIFLGFVDEKEKTALYKNARAFIYPTFYEGFGLPPLEAMNYHVPIIASYNSSLPEVLGSSALYVNPYNTQEIVVAINAVLFDLNLKNNLLAGAQEQMKKFSWSKTAVETLNIFNALV